MKKTILIAFTAIASLSGCASFQSAAVADYNHDGVVSDAEYRQYQKQKSVEASNVEVERAKRENARDTVRDVNDTVWNLHGIRDGLRHW